jgi:hypothetical protein
MSAEKFRCFAVSHNKPMKEDRYNEVFNVYVEGTELTINGLESGPLFKDLDSHQAYAIVNLVNSAFGLGKRVGEMMEKGRLATLFGITPTSKPQTEMPFDFTHLMESAK